MVRFRSNLLVLLLSCVAAIISLDVTAAEKVNRSLLASEVEKFFEEHDDQPIVMLNYCEGDFLFHLDRWTPDQDVSLTRVGQGQWRIKYSDRVGDTSVLYVQGLNISSGPYLLTNQRDLVVLNKIRNVAWYRLRSMNNYRHGELPVQIAQ